MTIRGAIRRFVALVVRFADRITPGGAGDALSRVDRPILEKAIFFQTPVRLFTNPSNILREFPPRASGVERGRTEFYHLLPWLYRSNGCVDAWICEHQISEGLFLHRMCQAKRDGVLVEVGRRLGGSTLVMAAAVGKGRLYSVDLLPLDDETLRQYFEELGFADRVELLSMRSTEFTPKAGESIDLLFLDGCKDTDADVDADLDHFLPYLGAGSLVLMHDYNELPVQRAVERLTTREGFRLVDRIGLLVGMEKISGS